MRAVADDVTAADHRVADVGPGGREDGGLGAEPGRGPAVRALSSAIVVKSASAPASRRPASAQPSEACPSAVAARSNWAAVQCPRVRVRSRSSSSMARASSNRSITAWLSLPRLSGLPASCSRLAGPIPSARSRSVVGHMQIVVPEPPSSVMSSSVRCVAWTAEVRGPSTPWSARSRVGVTPCVAWQASFSAGCSDRWTCSGAWRSSLQRTAAASWSAGTARTEWTAAPIRACGRSARASARSAQASASPSLKRSWCGSGAAPKPEER